MTQRPQHDSGPLADARLLIECHPSWRKSGGEMADTHEFVVVKVKVTIRFDPALRSDVPMRRRAGFGTSSFFLARAESPKIQIITV